MAKKAAKAPKKAAPKKGGAPGKVRGAGKTPSQPAPNPYDVLNNRRPRHAVLNERVKGQRRNVARSQTNAAKNRLNGLVKETLSLGRTSRFKDARVGGALLGENGWSKEEALAVDRFVKLRKRDAKRTFNLSSTNEAEDLTHGGKPLSSLTAEELGQTGRHPDEDYEEYDPNLDPTDPIVRSKMYRADRARENQDHEDKLGALDAEFSDIMGELAWKTPKKLLPLGADLEEPDGYDKLVRTLGMERKAQATDRAKTPEELAREEAEKLESLERARVARASGIDVAELEAAAAAGSDDEGDVARAAGGGAGEESDEEEGSSGDEEGGESESGEEDASGKEEDEEVDGDEDEDDRLGVECPDLMSAEEANAVKITSVDKGEKGVPMAPDCPCTLKAVEALLGGRSPETSLKLVQRVRACTAAALSAQNRDKLKAFFLALLEYSLQVMIREDGDLSTKGVKVAFALRKPLVEMVASYAEEAHHFFTERLASMGEKAAPKAVDFCCLKLIALLFPVTDFQHPVCSPALLLASHWAGNLASLGAGISDLISEAMLLWEVLYEFCLPSKRFCTPFFQLGMALLESCWASVAAGRPQCANAAAAAVQLLKHTLRELQVEDPVVARIVVCEFVEPMLRRAASHESKAQGSERLAELAAELDNLCKEFRGGGLTPLRLFETTRAQIRVLDPVFHEVGDRPQKGMEVGEKTELRRKLAKERRVAVRQLAKDATVLQQMQSAKDTKSRVKRKSDTTRSRRMMDEERETIKLLATEASHTMMDTSLVSYSAKKAEKKANKRLGGGETAENRKEKKPSAAAEKAAEKKDNLPRGQKAKKAAKKGRQRARKGK